MVYLSNKVFNYKDHGGIFLIDIRWKITFSDNSVNYYPIFTAKKKEPILLNSNDGLDFFRSIVLPILSPTYKPMFQDSIELMKSPDSEFFTKTDLYFLVQHMFNYFKYTNIIDHTCRVIESNKKITGRKISYLYDMEKIAEKELPSFGGKRNNRKTKKKRNTTTIKKSSR